jgi:GT-D fold-like domain
MKIYKINEMLNRLEECIKEDIPFSHLRFGDGGIKFLHSILYRDLEQLRIISRKEGIPIENVGEIFNLWGYYSRRADFIDTPEVYFTDEFWDRMRTPQKYITKKTENRMLMWKELYLSAEMDNDNYCNPESNYLMILDNVYFKNIFNLMKNRKMCLITAKPEVNLQLRAAGFNVDIIRIVGHYRDQYKNSFKQVMAYIQDHARDYDFWMVAAGELGRIYSGYIKEKGGRTIDIGFVAEFWRGEEVHPRLQTYLIRSEENKLCLHLTEEGKKYEEFI